MLSLLGAATAAPPDAARQDELRALLIQDCGSCHGLTLRGGLGPPLHRAALTGKPRELLEASIQHGRPGTAMPSWAGLLSADEVRWLVDLLLDGEAAR